MVEESLKEKTVKGVAWSGIDNIAQFGVTFVVSIVLARLLSPDDYGLIGIVTIFTAVCNTIVNGGFSFALIRKQNTTDDDYNTAFIVNLGLSVFLYAIIFVGSPVIASFFCRNELVELTRIASLGVIIGALALVQQTRLTKRIDFKTQTRITIVASLASGVIGIVMAFYGFGVWALVFQGLSSQLIRAVLLWHYNRWIPALRFSVASFKDLFDFGWKLMLSGILDTVWKEMYQVVVGKFYSQATLGQYTRAKSFSKLFSNNLTSVIQRVTYPVLSSIQDDKRRLVPAFRRIIKMTMFITVICMFSLGAVSEPLLYCLIGPKWHDAAVYLPLICVNGSFYPLHAINLNMLQVQGRSDLFLGLEIFKKILAMVPLCVGAIVGIIPMLWVNLVVGIISFFLNSYFPGKLLGYSSWAQIKDIAPSYFLALLIAIPVYLLKYLPITYWVVLPLQIIVGTTIFFSFCKATKMKEYDDVIKIVSPYMAKIKKH